MRTPKNKDDLISEGWEFTGMYQDVYQVWRYGNERLLWDKKKNEVVFTYHAEGKNCVKRGF